MTVFLFGRDFYDSLTFVGSLLNSKQNITNMLNALRDILPVFDNTGGEPSRNYVVELLDIFGVKSPDNEALDRDGFSDH